MSCRAQVIGNLNYLNGFRIKWKLNPTCNLKCEYCISGITKDAPIWKKCDIDQVFNNVPSNNLVVQINGSGEPLMAPYLLHFCKRLSEFNYTLRIVTNGVTTSVWEKMFEILDPKRVFVEMSYHRGCDASMWCKVYEYLRPMVASLHTIIVNYDDNYSEIIQNIRDFTKDHVQVNPYMIDCKTPGPGMDKSYRLYEYGGPMLTHIQDNIVGQRCKSSYTYEDNFMEGYYCLAPVCNVNLNAFHCVKYCSEAPAEKNIYEFDWKFPKMPIKCTFPACWPDMDLPKFDTLATYSKIMTHGVDAFK